MIRITRRLKALCTATLAAAFVSASGLSASAQDNNVITYVDFFWQDFSQATCIERSEIAMNEAIATFGLDVETRVSEWNVLANNPDYNFWVFCAADAGNGVIDDTGAINRILTIVLVASGRPDINENVRDFLVECVEFGCPTGVAGAMTIDWSTNAIDYRGQIGERITLTCPALGNAGFRPVWGTDVYTDDSSICSAAVHAGAITREGGTFTIEIVEGQASYDGTERNGVNTANWGNYPGSFRFVAQGKG